MSMTIFARGGYRHDNVVLIDLYVAVTIVVGGARYDNAGTRQHSGVVLLADTVWKGSGTV